MRSLALEATTGWRFLVEELRLAVVARVRAVGSG
jgi:hypothetical protein